MVMVKHKSSEGQTISFPSSFMQPTELERIWPVAQVDYALTRMQSMIWDTA